MNRSSEALTLTLLTNRVVDIGVKPFTAKEFFNVFGSIEKLDGIAEMTVDRIATHLATSQDIALRIHSLLNSGRALAFEMERLEENGVRLVNSLEEDFPTQLWSRLGTQCPLALVVAGPIQWLSLPNIGIVGSRGPSVEAAEVARRLARLAIHAGFGVASGLAKGIDQAAMSAGLDGQGRVCGLPTEGLRVISRRADVRGAVHDDALALASPFGPDAPFSVGNAMARNKLIYGLSEVTVVVTSDEGKGGTWAGATEAIDKHYGRVAVWMGSGSGSGNSALVARGATPIFDLDDDSWLTAPQPEPTLQLTHRFEAPRLF